MTRNEDFILEEFYHMVSLLNWNWAFKIEQGVAVFESRG